MKREKEAAHRRSPRFLRVFFTVFAVFALIALACIAGLILYASSHGIKREFDMSLTDGVLSDSVTKLYYFDENGDARELDGGSLRGSYVRTFVPITEIPDDLVNAFVAIEDKRFYSHRGVDFYRTARAGVNYLIHSSSGYGASTITQQLVKNLTGRDEVTPERKLQEIVYALDLETKLDKDEILELYLNIINLSGNCYGVGAAAERYFSKPVRELSLAECACIAAITKNPSYYDPIKHPENNAARRDVILSEMLSQGYISREEFDGAYGKELSLSPSEEKSGVNSWYVDMVINDIIGDLEAELGYSREAASRLVYGGGLKIYTLEDPEVQKRVGEYYADASNFPDNDGQGRSALIVMDPYTGAILGVAGNIGEKTGDRVQSYATDTKRPSGSTVKPLSVYAPGLEEGVLTWATVYDDIPVEFNDDGDGGYRTWPNNATMTFRGLTNVRYAIENSLNTVAVRALYDLGEEKAYRYLTEGFGLDSLLPQDRGAAALALGQQSRGVTLRELAAAYSVFANGGIYSKPRSYSLVMTYDGKVLLGNDGEQRRVIGEGNAAVMTKLLERVVTGASGVKISLRDDIEIAGKTGTTQNSCDRWFIGYTPYYLCGVWYGNEYPSALPDSTRTVCSETFNAVMTSLHENILASGGVKTFPLPENLVQASFCRDSGKIMTGACACDPRGDREETGWFVSGTQPMSLCDRHILVDYDGKGGGVATPYCPRDNVIRVGLLRVARDFPEQIFVSDAQYAAGDRICMSPEFSGVGRAYFASSMKEGRYCGISDVEKQYNCGCPLHSNLSSRIFGRRDGSSLGEESETGG